MFALCIESSHSKGMGHLFRMLNFIDLLREKKEDFVVFINESQAAAGILRTQGVRFEFVDLDDHESRWENRLITRYSVNAWINDRLDTDHRHARNVKEAGIKIVTFDDNGSGAGLADLHVAALAFTSDGAASARKTVRGIEYLVLNRAIERYKRKRSNIDRILVTLGGSDTYGVTVKVVRALQETGAAADIHLGPSFRHHDELKAAAGGRFRLLGTVPSLVELFQHYDLAITGGGITPFEANASGLPCIVIANELFEIANGKLLEKIGSSRFAGFYQDMDRGVFSEDLNIREMSEAGMKAITLKGAENVYREIMAL
jgi:spore coat polysaccharide biosynthesis predicted glycosyltransferase SpsG